MTKKPDVENEPFDPLAQKEPASQQEVAQSVAAHFATSEALQTTNANVLEVGLRVAELEKEQLDEAQRLATVEDRLADVEAALTAPLGEVAATVADADEPALASKQADFMAFVEHLYAMDIKAKANGFTLAELLVACAQHQFGVNIRVQAEPESET